ncbi:MAG: hypothetical protein GC181_13590 [Bacteroidetes bacterium]|nr:hypothetical protein [Bacteroidota bacterium]
MKVPITTLEIAKPCFEDWDAMTPVGKARQCERCNKQVTDISGWSKRKFLKAYESSGRQMCIRVPTDQLSKYNSVRRWGFKYLFSQIAIIWALLFPTLSSGQTNQTTIENSNPDADDSLYTRNFYARGYVYEALDSGKVIPGVKLQLFSRDSLIASAVSDSNGYFRLHADFIPDSNMSVKLYAFHDEMEVVTEILDVRQDLDFTINMYRWGTAPKEVKSKVDYVKIRGIALGMIVTHEDSKPFISPESNTKTYTTKELERYNFFR